MSILLIDCAVYLVLSLVAFGLAAVLWRTVFADFRNWLDRFLFWGTVVGVAIMFAGWYHALTGDRPFGFVLMMLALGEAVVVMVTVNMLAAIVYSRTPYDPMKDPEFLAELEQRRERMETNRQQYLAENRTQLTATNRRLR